MRTLRLALLPALVLLSHGSPVWAAECGLSGNTFWTYAGAAVLSHAAVGPAGIYVVTGSTISLVDQVTGAELNTRTIAGVTLGEPLVVVLKAPVAGASEEIVVAGSNGFVYGLHPTTLADNWAPRSTQRGSCAADAILAAPVAQLWNSSDAAFRAVRTSDLVFVGTQYGCGTTSANRVYALNASTGAIVWIFNATGSSAVETVYGLAMDHATNSVYATSFRSGVDPRDNAWALNSITGAKRWSVDHGAREARPTIAARRLLAPARGGALYALDPATGATLWLRSVTSIDYLTTPAVADASAGATSIKVYQLDTGGTLHAYQDHCTGTTSALWDFKPTGAKITTPPARLGAYLYAADDEGRVWQMRENDGVANAWATIAPAGSAGTHVEVVLEQFVLPRLLVVSGTKAAKLCIPWPDTAGDKAFLLPSERQGAEHLLALGVTEPR